MGAIGGSINPIAQVASNGVASPGNTYREGDFRTGLACAPAPKHIQVSSYGYIVRPVARAIKTKHAGLNLGTWATSKSTSLTGYKL